MGTHLSAIPGPAIEFQHHLPGVTVRADRRERQPIISVWQGKPVTKGTIRSKLDGATADGDLRAGFSRAINHQFGVEVEPEPSLSGELAAGRAENLRPRTTGQAGDFGARDFRTRDTRASLCRSADRGNGELSRALQQRKDFLGAWQLLLYEGPANDLRQRAFLNRRPFLDRRSCRNSRRGRHRVQCRHGGNCNRDRCLVWCCRRPGDCRDRPGCFCAQPRLRKRFDRDERRGSRRWQRKRERHRRRCRLSRPSPCGRQPGRWWGQWLRGGLESDGLHLERSLLSRVFGGSRDRV